ncbi:hypothetical protein CLAIMM_03130 [Cladophialophora immunda]|nr:hypothetical protein CLAIMM_03130 [Cladophialophora immunda]
MHLTRATDDPEFRKIAKAVRLRAEDMIPWEGQPNSWCLQLEQLKATPAITRLFHRFEKTKLGEIIQRRGVDQPEKRITRRHGPDIVCFLDDTAPVRENQFIVAIVLKNPSIQQDTTCPTLKGGNEDDEIGNATSHENVPRPDHKIGHDGGTELTATNVEQKEADTATEDVALASTEAPPESPPQWRFFVEKLRQEGEIVVSTLTDRGDELIEWEEGDILELDTSEYLDPKAGVAEAMWISYNWV